MTSSPPWVSPMPTIPPSVCSSTTLRRKYGPWQPLAASSGGSGSAIGVTFSPVIVKRWLRFGASVPAQHDVTAELPSRPLTTMRSQSRRCSLMVMLTRSSGWLRSPMFAARWVRPAHTFELHRRRRARSMSRLASCFLSASRLSKVLRPRAMHSSTLAIPFLK